MASTRRTMRGKWQGRYRDPVDGSEVTRTFLTRRAAREWAERSEAVVRQAVERIQRRQAEGGGR